MNFRKLLLNRCQKEFEKDKDDDEIFEKKQKELEAASEVQYCLITCGLGSSFMHKRSHLYSQMWVCDRKYLKLTIYREEAMMLR